MSPDVELKLRNLIVATARGWIGTPYFPCEQKRGVGCDCGSLLAGVFSEAGLIPKLELGQYDWTRAWAEKGGDELYLALIEKYMHRTDDGFLKPGDVVMYRVGRGWSHGAIVVKWPGEVIHCMRQIGVISGPGVSGFFAGRERRAYSMF